MKRYSEYMDNIEASETLHEKLKNLEEPKKKPRPWAKYGAAAAALVLVAGAGAWGLSRLSHDDGWGETVDLPAIGTVDVGREDIPAPFPMPGIATVNPEGPYVDPVSPPDWMDWGYEVVDGEMAAYYACPTLIWTDASAQPQASLDYSLAPPDAVSRDATWDDVLLFMGGEKAMADHLLWDGFTWDGTLWFLKDGTPCGASFSSDWANGTHLYLEVMKGGRVPSCVVPPDRLYGDNWWQGVEITSLHLGETYEVSFFCNGTGYKLTLSDSPVQAAELCGRFVRYAVDGGFHLYALSDEPAYDEDLPYEDGIPDKGFPPEDMPTAGILHAGDEGYIEPFPEPAVEPEEDSVVMTTPYDPNATTEAKAPTPPN